MSETPASDRVLLDVRPLQRADAQRGIGTYVRGLLGGLVEEGFDDRMALLVDAGTELPSLPDGDFVAFAVGRRYRGRLGLVEEAVTLGDKLARVDPALYHATTLALPGRCPVGLVVTLHDLIPWALGGRRMLGERTRWWLGRRLLSRADAVIAVSEHTAQDAQRRARVGRDRLEVIPEAVGSSFRPAEGATERVAARHGIPGRYVLYVGALDARKDLLALRRAWRAVRAAGLDVELVVAGSPGANAPAAMKGARLVGHVTVEELVDLYSAAECLIFPTRYEGFGLPALEAMACGCPVVAYRNSSLPELVGDAAVLVDDGDVRALGRAAVAVVGNAEEAARLRRLGLKRAQGFTWRRTARRTIDVYERLIASG